MRLAKLDIQEARYPRPINVYLLCIGFYSLKFFIVVGLSNFSTSVIVIIVFKSMTLSSL